MTAASPKTSPSALRSPLPPSITHSTRPSSASPRASRSCSSSVHTTAFSVEPRRNPSGTLPPPRVIPRPPSPPHHGAPDRALASASAGPPARPRLQTALVVARRHSGEQLLHHPGGQGISVAKRRHRGQRRFPADRLPHAGAAHLHPPTAEGELRRRRPPVMMGALELMPALGARQRHRLLAKQLVQR